MLEEQNCLSVFLLCFVVRDDITPSLFSQDDDTQLEAKDEGPLEFVSYWKPNITINLVDDFTRYVFKERLLVFLLKDE